MKIVGIGAKQMELTPQYAISIATNFTASPHLKRQRYEDETNMHQSGGQNASGQVGID